MRDRNKFPFPIVVEDNVFTFNIRTDTPVNNYNRFNPFPSTEKERETKKEEI